jgi:hypothetical protein
MGIRCLGACRRNEQGVACLNEPRRRRSRPWRARAATADGLGVREQGQRAEPGAVSRVSAVPACAAVESGVAERYPRGSTRPRPNEHAAPTHMSPVGSPSPGIAPGVGAANEGRANRSATRAEQPTARPTPTAGSQSGPSMHESTGMRDLRGSTGIDAAAAERARGTTHVEPVGSPSPDIAPGVGAANQGRANGSATRAEQPTARPTPTGRRPARTKHAQAERVHKQQRALPGEQRQGTAERLSQRPGSASDQTSFGSSRSLFANSSTFTSLNVTTFTFFTNRAGRYMSHTHASDMVTSK